MYIERRIKSIAQCATYSYLLCPILALLPAISYALDQMFVGCPVFSPPNISRSLTPGICVRGEFFNGIIIHYIVLSVYLLLWAPPMFARLLHFFVRFHLGLFLVFYFGSPSVINSFLFAPLRLFPCLILGLASIYVPCTYLYMYISYPFGFRFLCFGVWFGLVGSRLFFFYCLAFNAFSYLCRILNNFKRK